MMQTPIGGRSTDSLSRSAATALVAALIVIADFCLVRRGDHAYMGVRATLALGAPATALILARGDLAAVGLRVRPLQSLHYWLKATLAIATAIGACILAV